VAGYIPRWFTRPWTVTHPSTNRARCRVTTFIETNALPLSHVTRSSLNLGFGLLKFPGLPRTLGFLRPGFQRTVASVTCRVHADGGAADSHATAMSDSWLVSVGKLWQQQLSQPYPPRHGVRMIMYVTD